MPATCTAQGYVYDANGTALAGELVEYRINSGNGVSGGIVNRRTHTVTSDSNGLVSIVMLQGYLYQIRYDSGSFIDFPAPTTSGTCSLSQVLGRAQS